MCKGIFMLEKIYLTVCVEMWLTGCTLKEREREIIVEGFTSILEDASNFSVDLHIQLKARLLSSYFTAPTLVLPHSSGKIPE